jgi:hypothetical protein
VRSSRRLLTNDTENPIEIETTTETDTTNSTNETAPTTSAGTCDNSTRLLFPTVSLGDDVIEILKDGQTSPYERLGFEVSYFYFNQNMNQTD